jgi:hypothetical protein
VETRGFYHSAQDGKTAWIEIFVDRIFEGWERGFCLKVGEILSAPPLPLVAGSAEAISGHAFLLLPTLRLLDLPRKQVGQRTQQL